MSKSSTGGVEASAMIWEKFIKENKLPTLSSIEETTLTNAPWRRPVIDKQPLSFQLNNSFWSPINSQHA